MYAEQESIYALRERVSAILPVSLVAPSLPRLPTIRLEALVYFVQLQMHSRKSFLNLSFWGLWTIYNGDITRVQVITVSPLLKGKVSALQFGLKFTFLGLEKSLYIKDTDF